MKKHLRAALNLIVLTCLLSANAVFAQTILQNNTTLYYLFGGTLYYRIDVPAGKARLSIQTYSSDVGDCDVYIRRGALPTTSQYDFRSINAGNNESITVTNPISGSWYIMLYPSSTFLSLTLEVNYSGTTATSVPIGTKFWDFDLGGYIWSSPAVNSNGTIYVGTTADTTSAYLYAINPDGTKQWRGSLGSWDIYANPAIGADGTIYVVAEDRGNSSIGAFIAVNPSGTQKWGFTHTTHGRQPIAISSDGTIYVPSDANSFYAVNPADGSVKWTFSAASGFIASSPVVIASDGTLYCGFYNSALSIGRLYAVSHNGTEIWEYDVSNKINTPAIDGNGTVIFGVPYPVNKVYAINADKTKKWESQIIGGSLYSECYVFSPPVIGVDGTVYISSNRRLIALNTLNGNEKWHHDSGVLLVETDYANGPAIDTNGVIYYGSLGIYGAGTFYAITNGAVAWTYNVGSQVGCQPAITKEGRVIFGASDGSGLKLLALQGSGSAAQSAWPLARRNLANTASLEMTVMIPVLGSKRQGANMVFSWPTNPPGYTLISSTNLGSLAVWRTNLPLSVIVNGTNVVTNSMSGQRKFYRLMHP